MSTQHTSPNDASTPAAPSAGTGWFSAAQSFQPRTSPDRPSFPRRPFNIHSRFPENFFNRGPPPTELPRFHHRPRREPAHHRTNYRRDRMHDQYQCANRRTGCTTQIKGITCVVTVIAVILLVILILSLVTKNKH